MSMSQALASFTFIFLAAAPGRTTFVMMMLAQQGKFRNIFAGAALAFLIQSLISVLLGKVLILLPQAIVEIAAGILFIYFGFSFWRESTRPINIKIDRRDLSIKTVFLIIFAAEFGDVSQLAIASASAKSDSKFIVFLLAVLALWIIALLAVLAGQNLKRLLNPSHTQRIASVAFFTIGLILLSQRLFSFKLF